MRNDERKRVIEDFTHQQRLFIQVFQGIGDDTGDGGDHANGGVCSDLPNKGVVFASVPKSLIMRVWNRGQHEKTQQNSDRPELTLEVRRIETGKNDDDDGERNNELYGVCDVVRQPINSFIDSTHEL